MTGSDKMKCPMCGGAMNHHADKVVYGSSAGDTGPFFGAIEEFHQCPACGASASRPEVLS